MSEKYLFQIGESVHASIPRSAAAMKELLTKTDRPYETPSEPLEYIISLIRDQAAGGADAIGVNLDAFGEDDPHLAVELMREYVKLVRQHSNHVPACIDSSDDNVLIAGLEQWYQNAPESLPMPLVNSIKTHTMDRMLPLRERYPYRFVGLLVSDESAGQETVDDLVAMAKTIFTTATERYGFKPDDIFFDTTVFPLAIDMPMSPDTPGYTYRAFEAIRRIMSDPQMAGVHTSLGITNCVRDLPGRKIGVCRAYVEKAREYGLDAGIVNINHGYGSKPAAAELLKLVDAFAKQDGSAEASMAAMQIMAEFCQSCRPSS